MASPHKFISGESKAIADLTKKWFIKQRAFIPLTFVNRLYPQVTENGGLDFIESTIQIVGNDADYMLADFPHLVFTFPD